MPRDQSPFRGGRVRPNDLRLESPRECPGTLAVIYPVNGAATCGVFGGTLALVPACTESLDFQRTELSGDFFSGDLVDQVSLVQCRNAPGGAFCVGEGLPVEASSGFDDGVTTSCDWQEAPICPAGTEPTPEGPCRPPGNVLVLTDLNAHYYRPSGICAVPRIGLSEPRLCPDGLVFLFRESDPNRVPQDGGNCAFRVHKPA